ncbi:MAG: sulfatase-like hydrolase/transferase [Melioribacteraceae bacterium]
MKLKIHTYFIVLILLLLSSCTKSKNEKLQPPNIILLVSEDNSPLLGCYGDSLANTPNLDAFSKESIKYTNAFANAPVCAPSRSTLISGMYATSMGTQNMRSKNPSPEFMKFFPYYLKKAGYFTSNRVKKDYNTIDQDSVWDVTDWWGWNDALKGKKKNQPFFIMYNTWMSHESKIHPNAGNFEYFKGTLKAHGVDTVQAQQWWDDAKFDTNKIVLPNQHPNTPEIKEDWAKYYECIELMDREMGVVLNKIKEDGFWENSIIIYLSDHGGVLAGSKRYLFDSGLRVPFLLHVPEKHKHLTKQMMGTATDDVISFVDLAPTLLNIAGIDAPKYMEGNSFIDNNNVETDYSFGFRGRMDERYDLVRTVRDKKYRYIRNYMPHRIYGGKIQYLWKAKSVASWERAYEQGLCNDEQSYFWQTKPIEELYEISNDPDNVNNLASNPNFKNELKRLSDVLQNHLLETKDLGLIPEAEMVKRSKGTTPYDFIRSDNFPFERVLETANIAAEGKIKNLNILLERLKDSEPVVRYWAATGCAILKEESIRAKNILLTLLDDESLSVRIASTEALYHLGEKEKSIESFLQILKLPKMTKGTTPKNTELYSNHFAITHALNVIDALNVRTKKVQKIIKQMANSERASQQDYDKRMAQNLELFYK